MQPPIPPPRPSLAPVAVIVCAALFAGAFFLWLRTRERGSLPVLWQAPPFVLTEMSGRTFSSAELRGHAWAVDFVFTNCPSICPTLASRMYELQRDLPEDFLLVSISVDPGRDTPERLREFAPRMYRAQPGRWFWLTGEKAAIHELLQTGFKVGKPGERSGDDIPHAPYLLLVDGRGRVRGSYDGTDREIFVARMLPDARRLCDEEKALAPVRDLPAVNAGLNGLSALLLLAGFAFVRRRRISAHRACMVAACVASLLFLASYLTYHHFVGSVAYAGTGWMRTAYFGVLISHTVFAALVVPMAAITLANALRERFGGHRRIARWTLPVWMYVSVSGVAVYFMLYGR